MIFLFLKAKLAIIQNLAKSGYKSDMNYFFEKMNQRILMFFSF